MNKIVPCPMCIDGRQLDFNTGRVFPCPTCCGRAAVTPDDICNCGRPCLLEKEGVRWCGRKECFEELQRDIRIERASCSFYGEDDDTDFSFGGPFSPHRQGPTTFGGGRLAEARREWMH